MEILTDMRLTRRVRDFFRSSAIRGSLAELSGRLPGAADFYVAGGAIRNLLMAEIHGRAPATCDIDIFIGGLPGDFRLLDALAGLKVKVTDLQGIRWRPEGSAYGFDLCLIPRFVVIERFRLPPDLEHLMASIDFNINAVVYGVRKGEVYQRGCVEAVKRQLIDFNGRLIPEPRLMLYRILLMRYKTGFRVSGPVFDFLKQHLDLDTMNWLQKICVAKQGKARAAAIRREYDGVCTASSYADWLASIQ